jgi:tripartite-type tricarboxylate transporter receptor subunit TctC
MKRCILSFTVLLASLFFLSTAWAVNEADISNHVNTIVKAIESGKDATTFKSDDFTPYAFIMKDDGVMLVHPSLAGKSLKQKAPVVYEALLKATPKGVWVQYEWQGKMKHTYAKRTKNNLIVGSGY